MTRTVDAQRRRLVDDVMARVEAEPVPTAGRAFVRAVRRGAPVQAFAALATAWRLATLRTRPVPLLTRVRAAALALGVGGVLATSSAVALASVASVAQQVAVRLGETPRLEPVRSATPSLSASDQPSARPFEVSPSSLPDGSELPRPRWTAPASPTPAPDRTARPTTRPGQGGDGSGDGGSASTPRPTATSGGGDGSGDGGSDGRETASPTPTARPTETPQPSETSTDGGSSSTDGTTSGH